MGEEGDEVKQALNANFVLFSPQPSLFHREEQRKREALFTTYTHVIVNGVGITILPHHVVVILTTLLFCSNYDTNHNNSYYL